MNNIVTRRRYTLSSLYDAEVEYLESAGNSYINTGLLILSNVTTGTIRILCGGVIDGYNPTGNSYKNACIVNCRLSNLGFFIGRSKGTWNGPFYTSVKWNKESEIDIALWGTPFTIDESHDLLGIKTNGSLFLFSNGGNYKAIGKLYYLKIIINDKVVVDFIPVRKEGVGYMFDKVSGKLFGNKDTEAFVIGPDITE